MKRVLLLLVIFSVIGCTKEKESNSIVGSWRLTQINSFGSSPLHLSGTELSINFKKDGSFDISGNLNYTYLQQADRYEIVGNDQIRFFNATTGEEFVAYFSLDKTLSLSYMTRCYYEEKFTRR